MSEEKPFLLRLAADMEFFSRELLQSDNFMTRVHFADHLQTAWLEMQKEIEYFLKTGKAGMQSPKSGTPAPEKKIVLKRNKPMPSETPHEDHPKDEHQFRFRDQTMADAAAILLTENGKLHGREI